MLYFYLPGFQAVPLSDVRHKPPPAKETALEFLQKHLYGNRVHRESGEEMLPCQVKMQYVQLNSIAVTSIEHIISLPSIPMLKSCIYTCLM